MLKATYYTSPCFWVFLFSAAERMRRKRCQVWLSYKRGIRSHTFCGSYSPEISLCHQRNHWAWERKVYDDIEEAALGCFSWWLLTRCVAVRGMKPDRTYHISFLFFWVQSGSEGSKLMLVYSPIKEGQLLCESRNMGLALFSWINLCLACSRLLALSQFSLQVTSRKNFMDTRSDLGPEPLWFRPRYGSFISLAKSEASNPGCT